MARSVVGTATRAVRGARGVAQEAAGQLPRLVRLEQMQSNTRISLGLLVEERRRRTPDEVLFLFEDRAYTAKDVGERIDNVVRGLISIGVRQGEHVGVLMSTRPSALAAVAASAGSARCRCCSARRRRGPGGEARQVERVIADPSTVRPPPTSTTSPPTARRRRRPTRPRTAADDDLEQIDPQAVELPRWYRPDPGRASEVAFIMFTVRVSGRE